MPLDRRNDSFGIATLIRAAIERILSTEIFKKFDSQDAKYPFAYSFRVSRVT